MNVLSLFDGISCGQIALNKADIKYNKYYASEIEKASIDATMKNYPNTIQVGDVTKVKAENLEKIHLLFGGSPCQGFSFAGKMLNFDDPRSSLFFEFVRLLEETNPKYFLLENVTMKKDHQDVITKYLGVEPLLINSSLVSGHDRKRLYWTNIPTDFPKDRKIYFKDILDENPDASLFLREEVANRYQSNPNHKLVINKSCVMGKLSKYQGDRVFDINGKASSLSANGGNNGGGGCNIILDPKTNKLRRLSVNECERLQTVPVGYLDNISKTGAYKALGNGWTVDVIAHIFKNII